LEDVPDFFGLRLLTPLRPIIFSIFFEVIDFRFRSVAYMVLISSRASSTLLSLTVSAE
jgi:hypothetical protein